MQCLIDARIIIKIKHKLKKKNHDSGSFLTYRKFLVRKAEMEKKYGK